MHQFFMVLSQSGGASLKSELSAGFSMRPMRDRSHAVTSVEVGGGGKDLVVREWKAQSRRRTERDKGPVTHPRLRATVRSRLYESSGLVTRWPVDCKAATAARAWVASRAFGEEVFPARAIADVTSCSERRRAGMRAFGS